MRGGKSSFRAFSSNFSPAVMDVPVGYSKSFRDHIITVNPNFKFYQHCEVIIDDLQKVMTGEYPWYMLNVPPGTGKSEIVKLLSSFYLLQNPRNQVGATSYGAMLAQETTRDAREYYLDAGGNLDPAQKAKTRWNTKYKGSMWGAGFGGAVRGSRYHLGIVDDPHKDAHEIFSDIKRERIRRFWNSTWLNRGHIYSDHPVSRIVIMQRLAEDDLCGYLQSLKDADKWHVRALDGIHSNDPFFRPNDHGTAPKLLPDWRSEGELLCPERLPESKLFEMFPDEMDFKAQSQQRPQPFSGTIFNTSKIQVVKPDHVPQLIACGGGLDLAISTKTTADWTVGIKVAFGVDGRYYVFPFWRNRKESPILRKELPIYFSQVPKSNLVRVESVQFQSAFVQELQALRDGITYEPANIGLDRSDKLTRAREWSFLVDNDLVRFVEDGLPRVFAMGRNGILWSDYAISELGTFPTGKYDDVVDSLGFAFRAVRQQISSGGQKARAA